MAKIRGKVDPDQANKVPLQAALNLGQWNMEYVYKDKHGREIDKGSFKADPQGYFQIDLNTPSTGSVEIKCKGGWAYSDDSETVDVFSNEDVINLSRRLKPR